MTESEHDTAALSRVYVTGRTITYSCGLMPLDLDEDEETTIWRIKLLMLALSEHPGMAPLLDAMQTKYTTDQEGVLKLICRTCGDSTPPICSCSDTVVRADNFYRALRSNTDLYPLVQAVGLEIM